MKVCGRTPGPISRSGDASASRRHALRWAWNNELGILLITAESSGHKICDSCLASVTNK